MINIWLEGFGVVIAFMTLIWIWSVRLQNAGIVDPFWGLGFVVVTGYYTWRIPIIETYQWVVAILVAIWGLRLFLYLLRRNFGKEEDYRYRQFRKNYGEHRYWWFSFFQVFLLQGVLLAFISVTILGAIYPLQSDRIPGFGFYAGALLWLTGFIFETVGDYQMARFKSDPSHKGKVMDRGLWRYTRHPNYFGDTMVWWGYGLMAIDNGYYWSVAGSMLMTFLIVRISGVAMLERNLKTRRPGYDQYIQRTSAFFPWFPKR